MNSTPPLVIRLTVSALALASVLAAQTRPASTTGPDESNVVQLDEFQVTSERDTTYRATNATAGTRLGTKIKDLPQSITVLTEDFLQDIGAINLEDALAYVGGVAPGESQPNSGDSSTIRGYGSPFPFKDGIRDESLNTRGDMADIERVEVLKGPSSFIYGNVFGVGGAINKVSKRPKPKAAYSLRAMVGEYDYYRGQFDATGPISRDKSWMYRVVYAQESGDTYRALTHGKRLFLAPKLTKVFSPTTQLNVDLEYLRTSVTNDPNVPIAVGDTLPIRVPPSHFLGEPWATNEVRKRAARVILDHRFTPNWTVRQAAAVVINDADKHNIALIGTIDPVRPVTTKQDGAQIINGRFLIVQGDVVGRIQTGLLNHRILAGYEFSRDRVRNDVYNTPIPGGFNVYRPVYNNPRGATTYTSGIRNQPSAVALYLNDHVSLLRDRLQFIAGARLDRIKGESDNLVTRVQSNVSVPGHWTPRLGVVARPVEALTLYAVHAGGFIADRTARVAWPDNAPVKPETGQMVEAGVKAEFLEGKLSVNAATFSVQRENIVRDAPIPPAPAGAIIQNGAEQAEGAEVNFTAELARGLTVIGSYNYLDAYVVKGQRNIADGKPLQNAPRHSGQLWVRYAFQQGPLQGVGVRFDIRRSSEIFGRVNQNVNLPGYTLMNAGLSYRWKRQFSVQLNVSNLADHYYYRAAGASNQIALGAPRTWMFSTGYNF
jgi:iron complex outermembrane recepter protein